MAHFPFLQLTAELRNQVYELLFPPGLVYRIRSGYSSQGLLAIKPGDERSRFVRLDTLHDPHPRNGQNFGGTGMGLLRTCRQLYNESIEIAYQNPIFGILDAFPPADYAMPFLTSLGSQALHNLRHLSLNMEDLVLDSDDDCIATIVEDSDFIGRKTVILDDWFSDSNLRCLFLATDHVNDDVIGEVEFLSSSPQWKWTCFIIEQNLSKKFVDEIHIEIRAMAPPSDQFVGRVTSGVKSWHDLPPISQHQNWRLQGAKEPEPNDTTNAIDDKISDIFYKDFRQAPNGAQIHLSIIVEMDESYDDDSHLGMFSGRDWTNDWDGDWM
ncbi:hypothetical protein MMC32_003132 [Xylographa parallela]|nr:hypothetical protein [Xylographa parallela]